MNGLKMVTIASGAIPTQIAARNFRDFALEISTHHGLMWSITHVPLWIMAQTA